VANISNLKTSILDLSPNEAYNLIRELRALRRELIPFKPRKKAKAKVKKSKMKQLSIDDMLGKMSPIQAKQLLEKLQKKE